jgi:hypothetical protein
LAELLFEFLALCIRLRANCIGCFFLPQGGLEFERDLADDFRFLTADRAWHVIERGPGWVC